VSPPLPLRRRPRRSAFRPLSWVCGRNAALGALPRYCGGPPAAFSPVERSPAIARVAAVPFARGRCPRLRRSPFWTRIAIKAAQIAIRRGSVRYWASAPRGGGSIIRLFAGNLVWGRGEDKGPRTVPDRILGALDHEGMNLPALLTPRLQRLPESPGAIGPAVRRSAVAPSRPKIPKPHFCAPVLHSPAP
jgi:hypothetical protein